MVVSCSMRAQGAETDTTNVDVMFVLDTSYSMNQTDKDKVSVAMLKLFTDISYGVHTRMGFVAYNDAIKNIVPLTELTGQQGKENLKKSLDTIECTGRTDTGLGLKKAWELLSNDNPNRRKMIVLLTDGEININDSTHERTVEKSITDIQDVVAQATTNQVPIYTVGMGANDFDVLLLQEIASKTGATSYMIRTPQDLLGIFNNIFARVFHSSIIPIMTVEATGEYQEINVTLPLQHESEVNFIVLSTAPLGNPQLLYNGQEVDFYHDKHYEVLKIVNPDAQEFKLRFKGVAHDVVSVSTLSYYDLSSKVEVSSQPLRGKTVTLSAYVVDNTNSVPIIDEKFYEKFVTIISIKNLQTGAEVTIPTHGQRAGWEGTYSFPEPGRYLVRVQSDSDFYQQVVAMHEVNVQDENWIGKISIPILVVALVALIYYREKKPKKTAAFRGQIHVYYQRLRYYEETKIPALTIELEAYNGNRRIDLGQILQAVKPNEDMQENEKIWFAPGNDETVILFHNSLCTIMVEQTVIPKNERYFLHNNDKVHIVFPENGGELELHYKY